jgi:3-oxoacyl-[acyl-carrier protein] reductase
MRCKDKVAIVTGGGRGIGKAVALAMAKEGARIAIWDVSGAAEAASAIKEARQPAMAQEVDVSSGAEVRKAVEKVLSTWGAINILVNCAGVLTVVPTEEITEEEWDRVLGVNLRGTFNCCQAVMKTMKERQAGNIINFTSQAAKSGGILVGAHYPASKAGILCLTLSLARELAPHGIRVNGIAPGIIETEMIREVAKGDMHAYDHMIPMGRVGRVDEVASVAVFLASDDSSYITGEIIDVNGGQLMD